VKTCARCGTANADDSQFCSNCGYSFEQAETPTPQAAPPSAQALNSGAPGGPYAPPPGGYPPQAPLPGTPYQGAPYPGMASTSNSKATASLVLGIIGIFFCPVICSILAIVFGYTARNEIAASGGMQTGGGNATAGIILGWVGIAITVIWIIIVIVAVGVTNAALIPFL
jgi:hypothetical protein